jgi:hypothetical protein
MMPVQRPRTDYCEVCVKEVAPAPPAWGCKKFRGGHYVGMKSWTRVDRGMCLAPHPTETYNCTKRGRHRSRYHVCFLTDLGAFGDQPKQVYLRWKVGTPVDTDSPVRQRARDLIPPGTPASRERVFQDIIKHVLDDLDARDAASPGT